MRERRWLWLGLAVFLFPLTFVAGRFCAFGPTDAAYHALVALHRFEPPILIGAVLLSLASVVVRLASIRGRLAVLRRVASSPPANVAGAFAAEAVELRIAAPEMVYVTARLPMCFTALARGHDAVFISQGFVDDLDAIELRLVARHELIHVRERHALWNLVWHVTFAAFVLPGFDGLERRLRIRREARANASAAALSPARYESLLLRRAREERSLCAEGEGRARTSHPALPLAPIAIVSFIAALVVSHAEFVHDLPYLASHHC